MGARINFVFRQEDEMPDLVLYSHWGETFWRENLAAAIIKAKPRLALKDTSYATRIIISQLISEDWDSETGHGIFLAPRDLDYGDASVVIDVANEIVFDDGHPHSFDAFCNYVTELVEYHG